MLTFQLNPHSHIPLYQQIYQTIQQYIVSGTLPPRTKLPSTRSLSSNLGVSRNTVDTAYYQLQAEGYIEATPKSGFYVCGNTPHSQQAHRDRQETYPDVEKKSALHTAPETETPTGQNYLYDFSPFAIDISHFPFSIWKKLSRQCLMDKKDIFLLGQKFGDIPLRHAICDYVRLSREVKCQPEQVVIGAGVDYLLQMLSLVFSRHYLTHITIENPGYMRAAHILHNNGLTLSPGSLDEKGLTISSIAPESQVVYVTPSHQYPLGFVMPFGRRKELLCWASAATNRYIIEDDHDSEFRYKGRPIPSLQGMDENQRVIYIGTFSRAIAPAIRVGYMILPPSLLSAYTDICGHYSCTVSRLDQSILTHFLAEGYFEKHVNRMRKLYRSKHDLALSCLQPLINQYHLKIHGENAGLHLAIELPESGIPERELIQNAAEKGIRLHGIGEHFLPENTQNHQLIQDNTKLSGILLGYSNLSQEEIKKGICLMADTHIFETN